MVKLIASGVGALLLGTLVGVGGAWVTTPRAAAPGPAMAESAHTPAPADEPPIAEPRSAAADGDVRSADSAAAGEVIAPALSPATPIAEAPGVAAGVAEVVRMPTPPADTTPASDSARRLAKVFAAMRPADAAAVLQELSDLEARDVLMAMPERAAGAILTQFEPGRAATISRGVLRRSS